MISVRWIALCLGVYLGTSPIYWLPNVPLQYVGAGKAILFSAAVIPALVNGFVGSGSARLPKRVAGPLGFFLLLFATIAATYANPASEVLRPILNILLPATVFFAAFHIAGSGKQAIPALLGALTVSAILAALLSLALMVLLPSQLSPWGFSVKESGLAGLRTGWSNGLAILLPIALGVLHRRYVRKGFRPQVAGMLALALSMPIILSQFLVGGRTGLLASILTACLFCLFNGLRRLALFVVMAVAAYTATNSDFVAYTIEHLRIDRILESQAPNIEALDSFSAGRITAIQEVLESTADSPIFGHGFGQRGSVIGTESTGHSLLIRLLGNGGVLLLCSFLLFVGDALRYQHLNRRKLVRQAQSEASSSYAFTLLNTSLITSYTGLLICLAEPNYLIGAFQISSTWWAMIGASMGAFLSHSLVSPHNNGSPARC